MSTMRRPLGTGPVTPAPQPSTEQQLRLLAAERIAPGARLTARGDEAPEPRARRKLGTGTADTPGPRPGA
ncbi:hypothetical protein OG892_39770 [Streptomyces sp. NBC_00341]|uniref:hypothetical protein n=1 Tax=Streptomyces sp. NBC_00341 TaxID=2975717 RepID=UPI003092C2CF|nr:hypothetical protein OG892_39770 [Streptomyces sp. NBC_00341]